MSEPSKPEGRGDANPWTGLVPYSAESSRYAQPLYTMAGQLRRRDGACMQRLGSSIQPHDVDVVRSQACPAALTAVRSRVVSERLRASCFMDGKYHIVWQSIPRSKVESAGGTSRTLYGGSQDPCIWIVQSSARWRAASETRSQRPRLGSRAGIELYWFLTSASLRARRACSFECIWCMRRQYEHGVIMAKVCRDIL